MNRQQKNNENDNWRGAHPCANLILNEVINNKEFRFRHVPPTLSSGYCSYDCNGLFPKKNGYQYNHLGTKQIHPDDNCTFFFWQEYFEWESEESSRNNPEWIHSWKCHYIFDGQTNYWNCARPKYDTDTNKIPIECDSPNDETTTDRSRRYVHYRKERCSWGLKNCVCSASGGQCDKLLNEHYQQYGWTDDEDVESDDEFSNNDLYEIVVTNII